MNPLKQIKIGGLAILALLAQTAVSFASSIIPLSTAEQLATAAAVCRGTVVGATCFRDADGLIYTATSLRVEEPLLGRFPDIVKVVHRGGQVGNEDEYFSLSPRFEPDREYLVFVTRGKGGRLQCVQGFASAIPLTTEPEVASGGLLAEVRSLIQRNQLEGDDVRDQVGRVVSSATTGMLNGVNTRFLQPDRGEGIPYQIDADSLPAGITLQQATNAVQQALNGWMAVTSLKFKFDGFVSFGQGADTITTQNEKLRIQLHDNYGSINAPSVLGIGGRSGLGSTVPGAGWDLGGNVAGNEFRQTAYGYVVLESGSASLQNLATFTEVLCHEIGHALNMAHSSENSAETDPTLRQAIMFYQAHADGRGATLGTYDPPVIRQCYPFNTPPFTFNRVLDVTTASPQPNVPGINSVEVRGYDLQTTNLTLVTANPSANNGTFTITGTTIKYTADFAFSDSGRLDPAGTTSYESVFARCSDGTNASPWVTVRVLSYNFDSFPAGASDGIPNTWMTTYFGDANPAAGPNRGAQQDWDGDRLKNIDEYRAGMNPALDTSAQRITTFSRTNLQFQAKPYELYELMASTNMTNWGRAATPLVPTTSTGTFTGFTNNAPHLFFRVLKVP